jgi:hypothetical protein
VLGSCVTCSVCMLLIVRYTILSAFVPNGKEMSSKSVNSVDNFCYICREITFASRMPALTSVIKQAYTSYTLLVKYPRTRAGLCTCAACPFYHNAMLG